MDNELSKLDEEIRLVRAQLEKAVDANVIEGKSVGGDENILRQNMYLEELILNEQHIRMALENESKTEKVKKTE